MQKVQIFTQNMTLYQEFELAFKKYAKSPDFHGKYDLIKYSNLHSKGTVRTVNDVLSRSTPF